jgi:hypothetical protein
MGKLEKLTKKAQEHLEPGEEVKFGVSGAYETKRMGNETVRNGVLLATNRRLVFFAKRLTGYDLEVFPYPNISSFEMGKNIMGHYIHFFASGNKVAMKWIKDKEIGTFISFVKEQISKKSISDGASRNSINDLKEIAVLKDQGIVTEEEFQAKKRQILGL